jgi:hypothetical protein
MTAPQEDNAPPDLAELEVRVRELNEANQSEAQAISQFGAQLDPNALNRMRIDTLVGFVFGRLGNAPPEIRQTLMLLFEIEFQQNMAEALKAVKSEVRKNSLGLGAQASPAQMRDMWRRQQNGGL